MSAATVLSGAEKLSTEALIGRTVEEIRSDFEDILNIPDDANALVNGRSVDDYYTLRDGDELVFSRPVGQKG